MYHKCIGQNLNGIRWICSEDAGGNLTLESEGIPDSIRVAHCPFCGAQAKNEDTDDIVYQLKKYQLV